MQYESSESEEMAKGDPIKQKEQIAKARMARRCQVVKGGGKKGGADN